MKCFTSSHQNLNNYTRKYKKTISIHPQQNKDDYNLSNRPMLNQNSNNDWSTKSSIKNIPKIKHIDTKDIIIKSIKSNQHQPQSSRNDTPHPQIICVLCENPIHKTSLRSFLLQCNHKLCYTCAKRFYEEKIEEGERSNFKCCIMACSTIVSMNIINDICSINHLRLLKKNNSSEEESHKDNKEKINEMLTLTESLKKTYKNTKEKMIEKYTMEHVIDVNSNEYFYQYNYQKQVLCPHCHKMALYGKINKHYARCLNCCYKLCKHCMLEFDAEHLVYKSDNFCKVYYRIEKNTMDLRRTICHFFLNSLLIICGYLLIIAWLVSFPFKETIKIRNFIGRIICFFLSLIALVVIIPPLIIIIPYYPIMTCILY